MTIPFQMESKSPEGVRLPSVSPPPLPGDTPDAYSGAGESKEDVLPTKPATAAPPSPKIGAVQVILCEYPQGRHVFPVPSLRNVFHPAVSAANRLWKWSVRSSSD